ncbi:unnamed protein product [Brachionus calyciflorus]|uniref:SAM domain-containing protein n=1 Tax=Brachionus calyciflorus TaxID=104777 RepID=A0A814AL66_9BILA|nr:unnamed protein product [Brachionus calyciflorus]
MNKSGSEILTPKQQSQENIKDLESGQISQYSNSVYKWNVEKVLDWLNRKFPSQFDNWKETFIQNQITGEILLELTPECLSYLNITDSSLRDQFMLEIAIIKIRNEYDFIRRFKSQSSN